jgi:hypothetical protein
LLVTAAAITKLIRRRYKNPPLAGFLLSLHWLQATNFTIKGQARPLSEEMTAKHCFLSSIILSAILV